MRSRGLGGGVSEALAVSFHRPVPQPLSQARTPLLTLRSGRRGQPCPVAWLWGDFSPLEMGPGGGLSCAPPQPRTPCHVCASTQMTARRTGTARSPPQPHFDRPALAGVSPPCLLSCALGARPPRLGRPVGPGDFGFKRLRSLHEPSCPLGRPSHSHAPVRSAHPVMPPFHGPGDSDSPMAPGKAGRSGCPQS